MNAANRLIVLDDIIFDLQRSGEIAVRWAELFERLKRTPLPLGIIAAESNLNAYWQQLSPYPQFGKAMSRLPLTIKQLCPIIAKLPKQSVFHSSYYRVSVQPGIKNIVTVHDFINERFQSGPKAKLHRLVKTRALQRAAHIICVSENTRKDLHALYPEIPVTKTSVIYSAPSAAFYPLSTQELTTNLDTPYGRELIDWEPFVLFESERSGYKRFDRAVNIVSATKDKNLLCIGGGSINKREQALLDAKLKGRWFHQSIVSNQELNLAYNICVCLLHTSSYEGAGLSLLEAQRAGAPVIAANNSSVPELVGSEDFLADAHELATFVDMIAQLEDDSTRQHFRAQGINFAQKFSWDKSHRNERELYELFLNH